MGTIIVLSGQKSVTTAGTAVQFTSTLPGLYEIRPLHTNTGTYIYVGNNGTTVGPTSVDGYQLMKGVDSLLVSVTNLKQLWLNSDTDGDGACWHRIAAENTGITPPTA